MTISQNDIDSFHNFASEQLSNGGHDKSMEDLLKRWYAHREEVETLASIQRGVDDAETGRVHSLDEVDTKIRSKLGFPARTK